MGGKGTKLTQDEIRELQKATYCKFLTCSYYL